VLLTITARKAINLARHERRQKRHGGRVVNDITPPAAADESAVASLIEQAVGREPTPAFAAQVAEECERLLAKLPDGKLRQIAIWKMEGYTNAEIADKIERAEVTVERRLDRIRTLWNREVADE
jgi:DNA-directed RNA polymerase specialized sigma24 family protein